MDGAPGYSVGRRHPTPDLGVVRSSLTLGGEITQMKNLKKDRSGRVYTWPYFVYTKKCSFLLDSPCDTLKLLFWDLPKLWGNI